MRVTVGTAPKAPATAASAVPDRDASVSTLDTYLPVSFTRGVLLGGLDAPTGGQSQSNPHPVLIRLSDNTILPNQFRAEYRECFVIAAGYGDISAERAYLRTESLSCVRPDGRTLEVRIQGSVYGEDGKVGLRGRLVTKQGQMLANALRAGIAAGIGQAFASANATVSTSALGAVSTQSGGEALRAGRGTGVGRALDRLAQFYIKLAEQTFPIIEIDAGREVDVVITKGVRIEGGTPLAQNATSTARLTRSGSDEPGGDDEDR
jgi:conjugal transfer pilus assembly protein TraB